MRSVSVIAIFLLLASGCARFPSTVKPVLREEGEILVYLERFPSEAQLTCAIDTISAIRSDGSAFPLSIVPGDFNANGNDRQRLVAAGRLPPGPYIGMSYHVKYASLAHDDRADELQVPEGPVTTDFHYEVRAAKALVLSLTIQHAPSVDGRFQFTPEFSLEVPGLPAPGLMGYAVNHGDNSLTLFDKKSGRVASVIATGGGPYAMVLNGQAGKGYVSISREDVIEVIDTTDGGAVNRIHMNTGDAPTELSLTADGRFLLSLNAASKTLSILDPELQIEISRVQVGEGPRTLLVGQNGVRCYVFNSLSNTISVIDIVNGATVGTIQTEAGPLMGQFNRKGDRLYVIHDSSPYLLVIDPVSFATVRKVFVGTGLSVIKVDPATDMIYAYRNQDARIEVYDPFSLVSGDYITATGGVVRMTIDNEANSLYAVSSDANRLLAIDLISKKIVSETDVGLNPSWVTMMGER